MMKLTPPQIHKPTKRNLTELHRLLKHYPIPTSENGVPFFYDYGTAGFRYNHKLLPPILIRMGILASLRSAASTTGESIGIMITASHNPEIDNGIKLADSDGGMMSPRWESRAISIANTQLLENNNNNNNDDDDVESSLSSFFTMNEINNKPMIVHIGIDTRSHSRPLAQLAIRAALAMGAIVMNHGCVTTPQLHWSVLRCNPHNMTGVMMGSGVGSGSGGLEREYLEGMVGSYVSLLRTKQQQQLQLHSSDGGVGGTSNSTQPSIWKITKKRKVLVDCACGVGGLKIPLLNSIMRNCEQEGGTWWMMDSSEEDALLHLVPVNLPGEGPLNENCGAEYVQKQQQLPRIYTEEENGMTGAGAEATAIEKESLKSTYVASLDGDADRIVIHYKNENNTLCLLDGDKIAVLVAIFIQEELSALMGAIPEAQSIRCGVVQTAYANGASTHYLKNTVKTQVKIAKTGVKFVHEAAHSHFDVGIYFEANGHGTVIFGHKFYEILAIAEQKLLHSSATNRPTIAWQRLRVLPRLINQAVGDALSDLLLVDAILFLKGMTLQGWAQLYRDMPSRQCKVRVKDRAVVTTNDNETKALTPPSLQEALNFAVTSLSTTTAASSSSGAEGSSASSRTFVRPSGTENVVRVYAEAGNQKDADLLASEAAALVYKLCDGVGECPSVVGNSKL